MCDLANNMQVLQYSGVVIRLSDDRVCRLALPMANKLGALERSARNFHSNGLGIDATIVDRWFDHVATTGDGSAGRSIFAVRSGRVNGLTSSPVLQLKAKSARQLSSVSPDPAGRMFSYLVSRACRSTLAIIRATRPPWPTC